MTFLYAIKFSIYLIYCTMYLLPRIASSGG